MVIGGVKCNLHHSSNKHRQTPFYRLLRVLLVVCQIFCVAPTIESPEGPRFSSILRRLHHMWCLIVLLHIGVVNIVQASYAAVKHLNVTTIETGLYLSEFGTNILIVAFIISSCHWYRIYFTSVPSKILQIHYNIERYELGRGENNMDTSFRALYRELKCVVGLASIFLASCFMADLVYANYNFLETFYSSSAYNLPNVLMSLNLGQYWLGLRFVCHLYRRLNNLVMTITPTTIKIRATTMQDTIPSDCNSYQQLQCSPFYLPLPLTSELSWFKSEFSNHNYLIQSNCQLLAPHEFLEYLRRLYAEVDRLLTQIVRAFEIIMLVNFLGSFVSLSVQFFGVYKDLDRGHIINLNLFVYKVLWIVLHAGRYFFVLLPNTAIIREKCRTSFILNALSTSARQMEQAINRFLLQLMVRKPETACGIITLDLMLLGGLLSALANYVIFLIQIDLGNESLVGAMANRTA